MYHSCIVTIHCQIFADPTMLLNRLQPWLRPWAKSPSPSRPMGPSLLFQYAIAMWLHQTFIPLIQRTNGSQEDSLCIPNIYTVAIIMVYKYNCVPSHVLWLLVWTLGLVLKEACRSRSDAFFLFKRNLYEPQQDKTKTMTYAPIEDSDQPGNPPSLISVRCALNG